METERVYRFESGTLLCIAALAVCLYLFDACVLPPTAHAQTVVTYTDANSVPTVSIALDHTTWDGRIAFRIQINELDESDPYLLATQSVRVTDSTDQMVPFCIDITNGQTVAVTSEPLTAAPLVILTGRAFTSLGCTGARSAASNPINVEFVPEVPSFLAPAPPSPPSDG